MSILHSKNRRPEPLKPTDYDHEINLVDDAALEQTRSQSADEHQHVSPSLVSDSSSRRHSDAPLRKRSLRKEITRRKLAKDQGRHLDGPEYQSDADGADGGQAERSGPSDNVEASDSGEEGRGRRSAEPETEKDILFENQRGLFLCGIPLFSSKALGNLDPAPWTTIYGKKSFTDTTNHLPPDPSWEWAWRDWHINRENDVDGEGWKYSFAFAKYFSWHGPTSWNSFVRRRAWVRMRIKKGEFINEHESHMLTEDYFTIHSAQVVRSQSIDDASDIRRSLAQKELEDEPEKEDIKDIPALLKALRRSRIDREKMEAVECFIKNGGDELYYLKEHMHEIMKRFMFQASRRLLLAHLIETLEEVSAKELGDIETASEEGKSKKEQRLKDLQEAVKAADDEVKQLEFWSDIKDMAEKGEIGGAQDDEQGWGERWRGLAGSAPGDVISSRKVAGTDDCESLQEQDADMSPSPPEAANGKGKGIAKE